MGGVRQSHGLHPVGTGRFLTNVATQTESGVDFMRSSTRRSRKMGPPGLVEKRPLYVQLMKEGRSNRAACRILGINPNTGLRWLHGRNGVEGLVQQGLDPRPRMAVPAAGGSNRYLSEDERIFIADRLLAGSSIRSIGRDLGRSASTISRELA